LAGATTDRQPAERLYELVDDFTVGYGGEEENRDHRHPFTRGHGREGLQRMLGADVAWNRAPDIAQQSQ